MIDISPQQRVSISKDMKWDLGLLTCSIWERYEAMSSLAHGSSDFEDILHSVPILDTSAGNDERA